MINDSVDLKLAPLKMEDVGQVNSIRLLSDNGRASIAILSSAKDGSPSVSVAPLAGFAIGKPNPLFKLPSLFGIPSWDVGVSRTGTAVVWTKPGSAISPLGCRTSASAEMNLTRRYPMGVFQNPRFVRGETESGITATALEDTGWVMAFFQNPLEGGYSAYSSLPSVGSGILLGGLMLRQGSGYLLFSTISATGSRGPERKDLRGESLPEGVLHCLRLNGKFQPMGKSLRPLGDTKIYEFDADIYAGRVFLLATTEKSYKAATMVVSENAVDMFILPDTSLIAEFLSPSVLFSVEKALAVVIKSTTAQRPQILVGQFPGSVSGK